MSCILAAQGYVGSRYARAQAPFGRNNVPRTNFNTAKSASIAGPRESPTRCQYVEYRKHAMRSSAATPTAGSMDEASFFIRNLRALPWQRAAVWLVVVVAASQLSDFFGVRFHPQTGFCAAVAWWQWPVVTACVSSCVTMTCQLWSACTLKTPCIAGKTLPVTAVLFTFLPCTANHCTTFTCYAAPRGTCSVTGLMTEGVGLMSTYTRLSTVALKFQLRTGSWVVSRMSLVPCVFGADVPGSDESTGLPIHWPWLAQALQTMLSRLII